ncbi:MAG: hypothetical protein KGN01_05985 [Patescibacteria group bacterium]|nr:hypothetical protein [Patescibacteria group bacterium]
MKKVLLSICLLCGCGYLSDAKKTVFEQTKASAVLKKYEWFKDAAAQLEAFKATVKIQEKKIKFLEDERPNWTRDDRQNWHQLTQEAVGVKAAYNNLAAEYNANMSKINFKFANEFPREFPAYKEE